MLHLQHKCLWSRNKKTKIKKIKNLFKLMVIILGIDRLLWVIYLSFRRMMKLSHWLIMLILRIGSNSLRKVFNTKRNTILKILRMLNLKFTKIILTNAYKHIKSRKSWTKTIDSLVESLTLRLLNRIWLLKVKRKTMS